MHLHWNKYIAELIGTFVLTFMVLSSLAFSFPLATPLVAGLTLMLFVYTFGNVSGTHINPAVTLGLLVIKKIDMMQAAMYIVSQLVGAMLAMIVFDYAFVASPSVIADASPAIFVAEAAGAFLLLTGISAVVHQKVHAASYGLVIGGSLLLGILLASGTSNGVLNPAVAIGIRSVSWAYLLGPILGAVIATSLYRWLVKD